MPFYPDRFECIEAIAKNRCFECIEARVQLKAGKEAKVIEALIGLDGIIF
jgi:hypothetical protein